jgi:hypothetical protein
MTERNVGWGIAEQWIAPAVEVGGITSADKYYEWLRESGEPVPRAIVRDVWREYGKATQYRELIEAYPETHRIPRSWYSATESEGIDRYGYKVAVNYRDYWSGEDVSRTFLIRSDSALTHEQAEIELSAKMETGSGDIRGTINSWSTVAYYHHTGAPW